MSIENGARTVENGIRIDFSDTMDYASYLHLDELLTSQYPLSKPQHPDELLFIMQHQTTELWFKLVLHELRWVRQHLDRDDASRARKSIARVKHIFRTITGQWSVLATLTPNEYLEFRDILGSSSGLQSYQYRAVEFILGNKNAGMLKMFDSKPDIRDGLIAIMESPTVYDAFLHLLARHGREIPHEVIDRDVTQPWTEHEGLIPVFRDVYSDPDANWEEYAICEDLVDLEDSFQLWRFQHLRTVQRIIGFKKGTGGSSGVGFLQRALDLTFFPELYTVRTRLESSSHMRTGG